MKVKCISEGYNFGKIIEVEHLGVYSDLFEGYYCWNKYSGSFIGTPLNS